MQRIKIPISQIKPLLEDSKFILILRLSRFINQLAFCETAFRIQEEEPVRSRQKNNAFLFSCAVLYEALNFSKSLGREFSRFKSFKSGFATLNRDDDVKYVKEKILKTMRNQFVFHVDEEPFLVGLKQYGDRSVNFLLTSDGSFLGTHLSFADELVLNFLIGQHETDDAALEYFKEESMRVMNVSAIFIDCGVNLIREFAERKYWKAEVVLVGSDS